jgi:hypothetical protein
MGQWRSLGRSQRAAEAQLGHELNLPEMTRVLRLLKSELPDTRVLGPQEKQSISAVDLWGRVGSVRRCEP